MNSGAAADREIGTSRVFDVRRDVVFRAWSDSAHLARWWGPKGFSNTFHEFNMRPGGTWRFVMHGPDGVDYRNESTLIEVVPDERIVLEHLSGPVFRLTATFSDVGRKSRFTWRMLFESAEECAKVSRYAAEANEENLDRLDAELKWMATITNAGRSVAPKGSREMAETFDRTVRFSTFVRATPERVFDALATEEGLDRWHLGAGTVVALVEGTYEDSVQGLEDMYRRTAGWAEVMTLLKFHVELGARY